MQVHRIASMFVEKARPDDTIEQVARKMSEFGAGFLPVVDDGQIIGVITDRDIVTRIVAHGRDPRSYVASQAMSSPVFRVFADADHEIACRLMLDRRVRRLIVCDRHDRAIGILSMDDLALFGRGGDTLERVMEEVVEPDAGAADRSDLFNMNI